eukprot:2223858-Amphidinium_carterae.1
MPQFMTQQVTQSRTQESYTVLSCALAAVHTRSAIWGPDVETITWGSKVAVAIRQLLQKWRMVKSNVGLVALTVPGMQRGVFIDSTNFVYMLVNPSMTTSTEPTPSMSHATLDL